MNNAQLINQTNLSVNYGTPLAIIKAVRGLMGSIELDPASAAWANKTVGANKYFTEEDDGLIHPWIANTLYLNHPFGRESNKQWIDKFINEYKCGNVKQACCITFASTSERWFRPLMDYPQCYLSPRTNYYLPDGTLKRGVTKGSVVTYLGPNINKFFMAFRWLGKVMLPANDGVAA